MPYIPEEIVDKIIGCASAASDRETFCSHASLIIDLQEWVSLTKAINAGDAHALSLTPLVQELIFFGSSGNLLLGINSVMVLSFRNLTKLCVQQCSTSPAIMEQIGKLLVQLQTLHTWRCRETYYCQWKEGSYSALSELQSLHMLVCREDCNRFSRRLACISMKNLRILKSSDLKVIEALLKTDPSVQLKELWLTQHYHGDYSLLWNYLARVTSLTHLSLPFLELQKVPPASLIFPFQELQYLHIHVAFAPRFADQPLKEMKIDTESRLCRYGQAMVEVRQHWQGIVFPLVEYLETDRIYEAMMGEIPIEFWREFLLNVKKVGAKSRYDRYPLV